MFVAFFEAVMRLVGRVETIIRSSITPLCTLVDALTPCRDIPVVKDQLEGRCNNTVQGR